jgi:hypothetical protein
MLLVHQVTYFRAIHSRWPAMQITTLEVHACLSFYPYDFF